MRFFIFYIDSKLKDMVIYFLRGEEVLIIEKISSKTAKYIKNINEEETASYEVLDYGLRIIYNGLAVVLISMVFGFIIGRPIDTLIIIISFATLRYFSGGYHLKESDSCVLVSSMLICVLSAVLMNNIPALLNILSIAILLILAPRDIDSQYRNPALSNMLFKFISVSLVTINFLFVHSDAVTISFFAQSLTLLIPNKKMIG
ncbi:hypothetical protein EBB07_28885 [Paenibacillaceae bacterium]|nr:hypothetical protein EBB07_28885 [Paenibacillaceae bacterium]